MGTRSQFGNIKEKVSKYTTLNLTKKTSIIFISIFTAIPVFDSIIVKFSSYSGVEPSGPMNLVIFVTFSMLFIVTSVILLNSARKIISIYAYKPGASPLSLRYFQGIISIILIASVTIILIIIFQMIFLNQYSVILLRIQTYISHLLPLVFLSFLVFLFIRWFISSKRNLIIMLYAFAFSLVCINLIVSLAYLESYFSIAVSQNVRPYPIIAYVTNLGGSPFTESMSIAFDILSLSSFLLMWLATSILLSQYRHRMGRIKYFSLLSIPLLYYIFPFQSYFGDVFFPLLFSSPVIFSIIYVLLFSVTKQVGALFFSLSFWTASSLLFNVQVRRCILFSAVGMAILFGSIEISPLQYRVYPPYGLITEAILPLGAYLLFAGIFTSAKYISQDAELRKEFYKDASTQLRLLKTIGITEMERELEKRVKFLENRSESLETTPNWDLEEENIKQTLHEVLNEVYSKRRDEKPG